MAGMKFEYDEKGGTFYYFLISFYALILIPATYYFWPKSKSDDDLLKQKKKCHCHNCLSKNDRLLSNQPWRNAKRKILKIGFIIGWVVFIFLAYKVSTVEMDHVEYDPFVVLGVDKGASMSEIKRSYRKLSLLYHPDVKDTGDSKRFMKIAKAYAALTNEESRKNWEEYGNPDGPEALKVGIALPKWIVEKQNSIWVLALYGLVFMVILPVVVGTWWYRSIKFSGDQVLIDTTQLYYYFFQKTPNMILKRAIMILAGSMEFEKGHNNEITERPTDNEELPALIRELPHLEEKKKERPLSYPYSLKARALLHAHFSRIDLPPKTLEQDKIYLLKKCPYLVNEMINIVAHLVALAHAGRASHVPRLETIENCIKLSQMIVQAVWDNKSPLLQLPHLSEDMLRHFQTKRRNIRTIHQLVTMKDEERRSLLRGLSDEQYMDVRNVCSSMPNIEMKVKCEVMDDDDQTVTAGSIVTVTVELSRKNMEISSDGEGENNTTNSPIEELPVEKVDEDNDDEDNDKTDSPAKKATKVWEKNKKVKKGAKQNKKKSKKPVKQVIVKKVVPITKTEDDETAKDSKENTPKPEKRSKKQQGSDDEDAGSDSNSDVPDDSDVDLSDNDDDKPKHDEDEDEVWSKIQEEVKKENALETKSKVSHLVHCPYFPVEKYEWWWIYVADRKKHQLITAPVQICSLKERETIQLKFTAPNKPGVYQYTVCLRSDSYLDFDLFDTIKLDVKEAREIKTHPQWQISDDEDDDKDEEDSYSDSDAHPFDDDDSDSDYVE